VRKTHNNCEDASEESWRWTEVTSKPEEEAAGDSEEHSADCTACWFEELAVVKIVRD
jgi:hypothetical protein